MKRIIYNTKLKKILIAMLVVMILLNFIIPNLVFAEPVNELVRELTGGERMGPYNLSTEKEWDWFLGLERDDSGLYAPWAVAGLSCTAANTIGTSKEALVNNIARDFDISEEYALDILDNRENVQAYVYVTPCYLCGVWDAKTYAIQGLRWDVTEEDEANGITQEEVDKNVSIEGEDKDYADLGGILLSPVFYLINFIADAVISITGSIMDPQNSLDFGFGVLTNTKPNPGYTTTIDYNVDTTSFIPTNLIGGFGEDRSILYQYPHLTYTPEEIFSGKIDLLSIDFISGKNGAGETITEATEQGKDWLNIRKVVSQWYQILRMIAIIGLLSVLIYTGIKIILSANAKDKAKYKEWIMNWFMAVAILFSMHFIMAFIVSITNEISGLMTEACQGIHVIPSDDAANAFDTNLMGLVRFMIQSENFYIKIGYEVMYIALIWYTLKFTFTYLKRVLNMAFLTLIAPIVALTYPIDKINDGRAQGFDMWLKEYIFNALLQPMHCILYYILVGSAVSIAASNPLYGIVVLAFMAEAEKLLKKIFGFDKAGGGTVGGMANAFAAGAIASSIAKMAKLPKGNGGKGGAGGSGGNAEAENDLFKNLKATDKEKNKDDALFDNIPTLDEERNDVEGGRQALDEFKKEGLDEKDPETYKEFEKEQLEKEEKLRQRELKEQEEKQNLITGESSDDGKPIREKSKFEKGIGNVGKKLLKPYWDLDHKGKEGNKYNRKRLTRKIGRAALGVGLGIGAAAVQAGISITDGKYNPLEGVAAFTAGYAGGGQIASGFKNLEDAYKEGTLPDSPKARNTELMERAQKEWSQRDDVIKHNNNKYEPKEREAVMKIQKELLKQGVTDVKEMDDCIKYIKANNNNSLDKVTANQVQESRVMNDFHSNTNVQKVMHDPDKRDKFIDSVAKNDKEKQILRNKFDKVVAYDNIINKK